MSSVGDDNDRGFNYFVLFKSHRVCNLARQVVNTPDPNLKVYPSPQTEDVRWLSLQPAAQKGGLAFAATT